MHPAADIETLVEGCRQGQPRAQHQLYERYSGLYYALCLRYVGDPDLAQDALVEGFTRVFRHLPSYRQEGSIEAWMRRIFVRCSLNQLQRRRRLPTPLSHLDHPQPETASPAPNPTLAHALETGLNRLSELDRALFLMVAEESYPLSEVAQLTGRPYHIVRRHYNKARNTMILTLNEFGINNGDRETDEANL